MNKKILIVGAHPDDEILGVGGTICKHIDEGDDVYVCILTEATKPYWDEEYRQKKVRYQKEVDEFLGIKKRFNLNLPTVKLNIIPHGELNQKVADVVNEVNPDIIYTHYEHDLNFDHTLTFRACQISIRSPKKVTLYCFETLSETEWSSRVFKPNIWIKISEKYLNKKILAFEIYKTEIKKYPHPRSLKGIKILAKKRGIEICEKFAEAFIMIKKIK